jgi:O-Antigen ligase
VAQPSKLPEHAVTVVVALAILGLALANGGYSAGVYAAATVVVWWVVLLALGLRFGPRDSIPTLALVAGVVLAAFALLSMLSIAWADDAGRAYSEGIRAMGYAGLFTLVVILSRRGEAGRWLAGVAIGFVAVAVLALASRFIPSLPGGDQEIASAIPIAAARLSYPIGYWNGLAAAMAIAAVLLCWLGVSAGTRIARSLAIGALPLCALVVYLASSRGAAVAGVIGLAVMVAFGRERLPQLAGLAIGGVGAGVLVLLARTRHELVNGVSSDTATRQGHEILAATVLVVGAVVLARWLLDEPIRGWALPRSVIRVGLVIGAIVVVVGLIAADPARRLDEFNDPPSEQPAGADFIAAHATSGNGEGRYQFWSAAVDAFKSEPLRGIGAGGYEAYWNQHGSITRPTRNAHSLFLQSMAELGLPGIALLLVFFAAAIVGAARRPPDDPGAMQSAAALAVVAAGAFSAATDWTWELPAVFGPVVVAVALLTGPGLQTQSAPPRSSRRGWGLAAGGAALIAVLAAGVLMLAEVALSSSRDAVNDGDLSAAVDDATDAVALEPWSATPRLQLALVDEQAGDLAAAHRRILEAIDRSPDDWALWFTRARIEARSGDVEAANRSLARARELNPRSAVFQQLQAE